jgi:hypothetical protein
LFTVGRQSAYLKQLPEAKNSFAKLLCSGSQQASAQQAVFLREYLQTVQVNYYRVCYVLFQNFPVQGLLASGEDSGIPCMPVPLVESSGLQTLLGTPSEVQSQTDVVFVSGTSFDSKLDSEERTA